MLDTAETLECSVDHDGDTVTQSFTFLHADKQKQCTMCER